MQGRLYLHLNVHQAHQQLVQAGINGEVLARLFAYREHHGPP